MKKFLIILLISILLPSVALASPFLAATKSADAITKVEVEITTGGGTATVYTGIYQVRTDDPNVVNVYDLTSLAVGSHRFRVRWATASSLWSDWSDPFDAVKPVKPGGVTIKP